MRNQRPEWMPSSESIVEAHPIPENLYGADVSTYCGCGDCLHYQTGLRAKLHELESLIVGHEGSHIVDRAKARIEEIRKELGEWAW